MRVSDLMEWKAAGGTDISDFGPTEDAAVVKNMLANREDSALVDSFEADSCLGSTAECNGTVHRAVGI